MSGPITIPSHVSAPEPISGAGCYWVTTSTGTHTPALTLPAW